MKAKKIRSTSPDKVNGKLVKYKLGDCISIDCNNGQYLAVLITGKFNKYYDFTLLEYYHDSKPTLEDFTNGRYFGTRFGSWEDLTYAVDKRMISCKYVDNCNEIEGVGHLDLIDDFMLARYSYVNDTIELLAYYKEEIPVRIQKTINAEKFPAIAFVSRHLVEMKSIIKEKLQLTTE
ncbi:hypothetical protein D770_04095 [Flammeovirgaceae bacterium 311]|nr:hypothetical protein D770_04095 [Flammeovirgaceae bacterium 311]